MNILYFVNRFPKLSESFIINEIYELEKRGHQIAVFSLREPEIGMHHEEVENLDCRVGYLPDPSISSAIDSIGIWNLDADVIRRQLHFSSPVHHAGALYIAGHTIRFVNSLNFDIDHIHGHFLNWPKLAADYTASFFNSSLTTTAHAYDLYSSPNLGLLRTLSDKMDRMVTISEYNRRYLDTEVGTTSPVDVVHMGIDISKFNPSASVEPNRILTVARFEEKKGLVDGIAAVGQIIDEVPDIEYHIIGSGSRERMIIDEIKNQDLEDSVTLLGHVSDEQLIRELDEAELFLLPSKIASDGDRDGIPVALMEAMAMETIPVSTSVSGIPELIEDGENGLLVAPGDVDALSENIREYFIDSDKFEIPQSAPRKKVTRDFNVKTTVGNLLQVFESSQ